MDILSRVLSGIRVASPLLARMNVAAGVSVDMLTGPGLPFHHAMSDGIEVEYEGVRHALAAGEIVMFPQWGRHVVHFNGGGSLRTIVDVVEEIGQPVWVAGAGVDHPLRLDLGAEPFAATLLSGNALVDSQETAFVTALLPGMIRLSTREGPLMAAVRAVLDLVLVELADLSAGYEAVASRALEMLIAQTLRTWLLTAKHPPGWARGVRHDHIRRAMHAMYAEPGRNWTLSSLAAAAGQSRSAFAAAFRETVDETPMAHLRRLRVHLAATRLHHTERSVAAIAAEVGYGSNFALARAFIKETGMTAASFRRKARSADQT